MSEFGRDPERYLATDDLIESRRVVSVCRPMTTIHAGESTLPSPTLAFTAKSFSIENKKATTDLYVHYADNFKTVQMTRDGESRSNLVLACTIMPGILEDMILFLKNGQVMCLPINGGESAKVAEFSLPIESFKIFVRPSEGNQLYMACVLEVFPDKTPAQTAEMDKKIAASGTSGMLFDKLMVRHWDRWGAYTKRNHVFVCPLSITPDGLLSANESDLCDLMFNMETDCPGKAPGQGDEEYAISPDGNKIALAFRRCSNHSSPPSSSSSSPSSSSSSTGDKKVDNISTSQRHDMSWSTDVSIFIADLLKYKGLNTSSSSSTATSSISMHDDLMSSAIDLVSSHSSTSNTPAVSFDPSSSSPPPPPPPTASSSPSLSLPVHLQLVSGEDWHGSNGSPSFSPDGSKLAFASMKRAGYESDKHTIRVLDVASGIITDLTSDIDLSFGGVEWGLPTDSELYMYTGAQYCGVSRLFRLTVSSSSSSSSSSSPTTMSLKAIDVMVGEEGRSSPLIVPVPPNATISSTNDTGVSLMYYCENTLTYPMEIKAALLHPKEKNPLFVPFAKLTEALPLKQPGEVPASDPLIHARVWSIYCPCPQFSNGDITMPETTQYYFRGGGGDLVHAWYLPPCGVDVSSAEVASVPLVLIIHGGPQGAILNAWSYRWNPAWYAAQGYAVCAVNFHGSTGFGQDFTDSIRHDWGGKPFEDCIAAVDYVLSRHSYIDPARVGALGASYGGYMINWINGHNNGTTHRFKCLVNHDGIFSLRGLYFTTEELWFPEWEFGLPWKEPQVYAKWSPDSFVGEWATPTLVIQGGKDYRVCETEGIATFTALQRLGIPSQMLFFPDENHWVLKPVNSLKWHETVSNWLKQWLMK